MRPPTASAPGSDTRCWSSVRPVDADKGTAVALARGRAGRTCALRGRRPRPTSTRSAGSRTPGWSWRSRVAVSSFEELPSWLRRQTSSLTAPPVCSTCYEPCSAFASRRSTSHAVSVDAVIRSLPTARRSTDTPVGFVGLMKISPVALTRSTSSSFVALEAEADDREAPRDDELRRRADRLLEDRGRPHRLAYPRLQAPPARSTKHGPELQRPGTAVRTQARSRSGSRPRAPRCARTPSSAKMRRRSSGRFIELREQVHRREQPFVRVHRHRSRRARHPRATRRTRDKTQDAPAYAASTCSHTPAAARSVRDLRDPRSTVDDVVPTVATTAHASSRSRAGDRPQASSSSTRGFRSSSPSRRAARAVAEVRLLRADDGTPARARVTRRRKDAIVPMEAVSSMWPCQPREAQRLGEPRRHDLLQLRERRRRAPHEADGVHCCDQKPARIPGSEPDVAKYAAGTAGSASA